MTAQTLVSNQRLTQLEESIKTLRDLPVFGSIDYATDSKWPTAIDLLKMPTGSPIQVSELRWKKNGDGFGAIQVILSNGQKSPVFLASGQNADNLSAVPIPADIKKIRGSATNIRVSQIIMQDKNGVEIAQMKTGSGELGTDQVLKEGEQIIGVHGHVKGYGWGFANLGFVVWVPPKF